MSCVVSRDPRVLVVLITASRPPTPHLQVYGLTSWLTMTTVVASARFCPNRNNHGGYGEQQQRPRIAHRIGRSSFFRQLFDRCLGFEFGTFRALSNHRQPTESRDGTRLQTSSP